MLCSDEGKNREEKTTGTWTRANSQQEEKLPHNGRKVDLDSGEEPSCMSLGSLSSYPCPAVPTPAAYHSATAATASHPASSYQSYSCDDLYLVVDLSAEGSPQDPTDDEDDDGAEASVMKGCFKCTVMKHAYRIYKEVVYETHSKKKRFCVMQLFLETRKRESLSSSLFSQFQVKLNIFFSPAWNSRHKEQSFGSLVSFHERLCVSFWAYKRLFYRLLSSYIDQSQHLHKKGAYRRQRKA